MKNYNQSLQLLVGKTIRRALIDEAHDVVLLIDVDNNVYQISHDFECCEYVYYAHINQIDDLIDATIHNVEELEYEDLSIKNDVPLDPKTETFYKLGIAIHTNKGTVTFETRMEGNGNYGGELSVKHIVASDICNYNEIEGGLQINHLGGYVANPSWYAYTYYTCKDF